VNFNVVWVPSTAQELADVWLKASDRNAVTQAAFRLDQRLEQDPENEGESRPGNRRVAFEPPLGITFKVDRASRTVRVLRVWRFGRRP
jgi:hypothetical protein